MKRDDFIVGDDEETEEPTSLEVKTRLRPGEKIALVRLDGTGISTEGNLVKHNWFKGLELNQAKYSDILLTPEEAQRLHSAKNRMKLGAHASSVMLCYGGDICPMAAKCIFVEMQREIDAAGERRNIVPIGRDCPIETELFLEWVARYAEEFGVTDEAGNYTDQRLLLELAECEVLEHRMNVVLSTKYQDLSEDKVVAVMQDEYGEREQHVKDISDAAKMKEKLGVRKDKLYKALVATRHDQYKREAALHDSVRTDNANLQSEMLARIKKFENLLAKE